MTVVYAVTNSNLEGTFCVLSNPAPTANAFSITVGGNSTNFTYTATSDPNLSVANGQVTSMSGFSDVGGQNSVISLGYGGWGPPNNPFSEGNKWQVKAGTVMHELGHTMALTHGGTFYNKLAKNPADYTPSFEVNCKPNVQSSMSYLFQFDLLTTNQLYANNQPVKVVDYSEDPPPLSPSVVPTLVESKPAGPGILNNLTYPNTSWFQLTGFNGATPATSHCDGSPIGSKEQSYAYISDSVNNFFWSATNPPGITGNDFNFNGSTTDVMDPHNEWQGTPAQNGVAAGRLREKSAVDIARRIPRRKARANLRLREPLGVVAAPLQQRQAVALERAGRERRAAQKHHAALVKQLDAQLAVPAPPAGQRALGQLRVVLVGAELQPHDLADVGRGRQRMRQRPCVNQPHPVAAAAHLQRAGDAEDARAEDDNLHHTSGNSAHHLLDPLAERAPSRAIVEQAEAHDDQILRRHDHDELPLVPLREEQIARAVWRQRRIGLAACRSPA